MQNRIAELELQLANVSALSYSSLFRVFIFSLLFLPLNTQGTGGGGISKEREDMLEKEIARLMRQLEMEREKFLARFKRTWQVKWQKKIK